MAKKRTVMRSKAGKKLYAVRDEQGQFKDIQTYQRAQAADMRQKSQAELEAAKKSAGKKAAAKKVAAKKAPKKTVKKSAPKAKAKTARK